MRYVKAEFTPEGTSSDPTAHLHDVILPDTHGCRHEFACLAGSLTITYQDLTAAWTPSNCPEQTPKSG